MQPTFDEVVEAMHRDARDCNRRLERVMKDSILAPKTPPIPSLIQRRASRPCDACGRPLRPGEGQTHGSDRVCSDACAADAARWRRWTARS